jgi:anion-transporting  ArsA/GET3 family ATPase
VKERVGEFEAEIANLEKRIEERGNRRNELERVTKELAVAQRFLSTADSLSQAEVVRAMEALNEEIFQLTSVVADKVQVSEKHVQEPKQMEGFRDKIHSCTPLTAYLEVVEAKHLDDSLAIQIGWQAMLAEWSSVIIQAWVITDLGTGELSRDFSDIYASITSQCE